MLTETKNKISQTLKKYLLNHPRFGQNTSMFGKHHTDKTKEKMSQIRQGKHFPLISEALLRNHPMRGKHLSEEHKAKLRKPINFKTPKGLQERNKKISLSRMGHATTDQTRMKISIAQIGRKHSEETKELIKQNVSLALREKYKNISRIYGIDWNINLKKNIRERDEYRCQNCGRQEENRLLDVHHKNRNKKDNDPSNLITLCRPCHQKIERVLMTKEIAK